MANHNAILVGLTGISMGLPRFR